MKILNRLLIVVILFIAGSLLNVVKSQEEPIKPMAEFSTTTYDFGKIEQGIPAKAIFKVKNTSLVPLIISNVKPTCGCTIADYPKEPIRPGETGEIAATYNAKGLGSFSKTVYVYTNSEQSQITLYMKGVVVKKEDLEKAED